MFLPFDDRAVLLGAPTDEFFIVFIQESPSLSPKLKKGSPSELKWCSPMIKSEVFVVLLRISERKAREPRGVLPRTAGSSCRRFVEVDARHEASKRVATAPVASGIVLRWDLPDVPDEGQE